MTWFQLEDYETKMASYAAKIVELVAEVEAMEKRPDAVDDNDTEEVKVKIKQVEALVQELKLSINGSTFVYQSLHVQVSLVDGHNRIRCNMDTMHLGKNKQTKKTCLLVSSPPQGRLWTGWKGPTTRTRS